MKDAKDLIPWKVTDISIRPYDGLWSFNPSVIFDGQLWLCNLRCCDYAMPAGKTIRSPKAGPGHQSKNAVVILDPRSWKPVKIYKMHERDDHPRTASANIGFEDMRLFKTARGGLQGIAASLHLKRDTRPAAGGSQHQPPEQVLLSFDDEYNIVSAKPIRGEGWGSSPQKNWSPFTDCVEPRFLYSIGKGTMFDAHGPVHGNDAVVKPSVNARAFVAPRVDRAEPEPQQEPCPEEEKSPSRKEEKAKNPSPRDLRATGRGADAAVVRGRRVTHDAVTSRPSYAPRATAGRGGMRVNTEAVRGTSGGRTLLPRYEGLRGGTQLTRVGDDMWLGIGHAMRFDKGLKLYWHVFYSVSSKGKMLAASEPIKLAPEGIEFAAGMAIDGDRVVVSFGVDDMRSMLGETSLRAVMEILRPLGKD